MKATKRLNKKERVVSKRIKKVKVVENYPDTLIGRTVLLRSLPTSVKKAKKLFKVGKKYKVQKPKDKKINTLMAVHLKGKDDKIYYIQFPHWVLTAN